MQVLPAPVSDQLIDQKCSCINLNYNSIILAALIFLSGGMNIAWSIGFHNFYVQYLPVHTRVAWFIGAIIGGVFSCFLANKLPKKVVLVSIRNQFHTEATIF